MNRGFLRLAVLLSLLPTLPAATFGAAGVSADKAATDEAEYRYSEDLFSALEWRFVGPFRGGRVTTVAGVPGDHRSYYMGATGGGVWQTTNAGTTWENISDGHFGTATIGAVAVAPSDRNVIYVGTGESPIRGVTTSHGDGAYKSTDAGKTWHHLGLEATRQISRIQIDPSDADRVYLAAQGNPWGANEERGVYRTLDGGETWDLVLFENADTGAVDLSLDVHNPRVLYAAMWQHRRRPWFVESGGPGSALHKSTDGGDTWSKLGGGLPEVMGKIGVDVSAADPSRVYAIVEAEEGGLYHSNDAGKTWQRRNETRVIQARSWYYNHVAADPVDADTVYVMNVPLMKSIDGGRTFTVINGPHGDHHDLWIHGDDHNVMINGNDGGATVTFDGGKSWSSLDNQPTAQFYRVSTDDQFPYAIYGGQQDNSTVRISSRAPGGAIGRESWFAVGGGESAHIAFDASDPKLVYATSINGEITEFNTTTRQIRSIRPFPEYVFGRHARDQRYRTNWNAPVVLSSHDPATLYYGTQKLLRTRDRGLTWEEISPDLTRDDKEKQGLGGGPITNEQAGAEFYNTIFAVAESPHDAATLWVGSDDGLVHLTRDGGDNWLQVTPPGLAEAQINSLEISPHEPAVAYIAVAGYKMNDFAPHIYKTADYGTTWQKVVDGLPGDTFVRAVREDPLRRGLLYAATETGVFVSFDDGTAWQPLQLNLPEVAVTDLSVRQGDLVAATQGRGFWVLDDLSPLHQLSDEVAALSLHLFEPRPTYRLAPGQGGGGGNAAANPPAGVVLHYLLDAAADDADENAGDEAEAEHKTRVELEILDQQGHVVRSFSNQESEADRCARDNTEQRNRRPIETLPAAPGLNRWVWDLGREPLHCIAQHRLFMGFDGAQVPPGTYRARLTVDGQQVEQEVRVLPDPRLSYDAGEWATHNAFVAEVAALFDQMMATVEQLRSVREQVEERLQLTKDHAEASELAELGKDLVGQIGEWEQMVVQPRHETFDDDINWPNMLDVQIRFLHADTAHTGPPVSAGARHRMGDLQQQWQELASQAESLLSNEVAEFERQLLALGAGGIYAPTN